MTKLANMDRKNLISETPQTPLKHTRDFEKFSIMKPTSPMIDYALMDSNDER